MEPAWSGRGYSVKLYYAHPEDLYAQEDHAYTPVVLEAEALLEINRLKSELARWKGSFDGHVYVKSEEYSNLVAQLEAARDALSMAIAERDALSRHMAKVLFEREQ